MKTLLKELSGQRYPSIERSLEMLEKLLTAGGKKSIEIHEAILTIFASAPQLGALKLKALFHELIPERASEAAKQTGIALEALQKTYESLVRKGAQFDDIFDFLTNSKSKYVKELLENLVKIDLDEFKYLVTIDPDHKIHYMSILRSDYLPNIEGDFHRMLAEFSDGRLEKALSTFKSQIEEYQSTKHISVSVLRSIRWVLCEIASTSIKLEVLSEFKNARLIENVVASTAVTKEGKITKLRGFRQIWDGIIAEVTDNRLTVHMMFEVKSGMKGVTEALDQIFRTHFCRLISKGDEIEIAIDGVTRNFRYEQIKFETLKTIVVGFKGQSSIFFNQQLEVVGEHKKILEIIPRFLQIGGIKPTQSDFEKLILDLLIDQKKIDSILEMIAEFKH